MQAGLLKYSIHFSLTASYKGKTNTVVGVCVSVYASEEIGEKFSYPSFHFSQYFRLHSFFQPFFSKNFTYTRVCTLVMLVINLNFSFFF
jgi:hypothetical protein